MGHSPEKTPLTCWCVLGCCLRLLGCSKSIFLISMTSQSQSLSPRSLAYHPSHSEQRRRKPRHQKKQSMAKPQTFTHFADLGCQVGLIPHDIVFLFDRQIQFLKSLKSEFAYNTERAINEASHIQLEILPKEHALSSCFFYIILPADCCTYTIFVVWKEILTTRLPSFPEQLWVSPQKEHLTLKTFSCYKCGECFSPAESSFGTIVTCPECGTRQKVPDQDKKETYLEVTSKTKKVKPKPTLDSLHVKRRSIWASIHRVLGGLCIFGGISTLFLSEPREGLFPWCLFTIGVGLNGIFIGFITDVLTDVRWFLKEIAKKQ